MYKDLYGADRKSVEYYVNQAHVERAAAFRAGFADALMFVKNIFSSPEADSAVRSNCKA
jgi:hypothetical protein